jgi:hypothetical protein
MSIHGLHLFPGGCVNLSIKHLRLRLLLSHSEPQAKATDNRIADEKYTSPPPKHTLQLIYRFCPGKYGRAGSPGNIEGPQLTGGIFIKASGSWADMELEVSETQT